MATFQKFNSFVEAMAEKAHNLGADVLTVALTATANPPVAGNSILANLTEIAYTYLSSRVITTSTSSQTGGVYKLVINDLVLSASGGAVAAFQYIAIYNETAASDELIGFYDYGSSLTLNDGESLTLDFDGTDGLLQVT
jgi:hypothetical protein